jgi:RHS repeat-associated protein
MTNIMTRAFRAIDQAATRTINASFGPSREAKGKPMKATTILALFTLLVLHCVPALATETVTYYYGNPQGTPLATADAAGNILSTSDYRPYGVQALGTAEPGPGYTGHINDPGAGLVYMQARYYDPVIGHFLSADPASSEASDYFGFNRYAYASNNPVLNIDPDGRQSAQPQKLPQYYSMDPRQDPLLSTTGKAIAADVMFVVGAATNDHDMQATAVDAMADATSGGNGSEAVITLMMMGDGGKGEGGAPGGKTSTLSPGPFAKESIPGHMGRPTAAEQRQVNGLMEKNGCHSCGTKDPGTKSGNAVVDHQPPQKLGETTDFLPHCLSCARRQGGEVTNQKAKDQP